MLCGFKICNHLMKPITEHAGWVRNEWLADHKGLQILKPHNFQHRPWVHLICPHETSGLSPPPPHRHTKLEPSSPTSPRQLPHMQSTIYMKEQPMGTTPSFQEHNTKGKSPNLYHVFAHIHIVDKKHHTTTLPRQKNKQCWIPISTKPTHTRVWKEVGLRYNHQPHKH